MSLRLLLSIGKGERSGAWVWAASMTETSRCSCVWKGPYKTWSSLCPWDSCTYFSHACLGIFISEGEKETREASGISASANSGHQLSPCRVEQKRSDPEVRVAKEPDNAKLCPPFQSPVRHLHRPRKSQCFAQKRHSSPWKLQVGWPWST
jgi:hypothetical protein